MSIKTEIKCDNCQKDPTENYVYLNLQEMFGKKGFGELVHRELKRLHFCSFDCLIKWLHAHKYIPPFNE